MMALLPLLVPILTAPAQAPTDMGRLEPGAIETHTVEAGGMHVWEIEAEADCRVEGRLLQLEGDASLVVINPAGQELPLFDFSVEGREPFRFHKTQEGSYRLAIFASGNAPARIRYELYLGLCEPVASDFDARVDQWLRTASPREPAAAVWTIRKGHPIRLHLTGTSPADPRRALRVDEALPLGEIELDLARIAVLSLIASKQLGRDTPLAEAAALPRFDPQATVAHLLEGTAGLRNPELVERLRLAAVTTQPLSRDRFWAVAAWQRDGVTPPGSGESQLSPRMQTKYLQRVCETVTGEPYSEWFVREIFQDLGMDDSWVIPPDAEGPPIYTNIAWEKRAWVPTRPLGPEAWHAPMVSPRDFTTWLEFLRSEAPLAQAWRDELGVEYADLHHSNSGSLDLLLHKTEEPEARACIEVELGLLEGGLGNQGLDDALRNEFWSLEYAGQEMGRYGGRGKRRLPPMPKTPVRSGVAGSYSSPEVDLTVQLVRTEDGQLQLVHPLREKALSFYQSDEPDLAVSRWILIRSMRFVEDSDGRVVGFRASGNGLSRILFERVED